MGMNEQFKIIIGANIDKQDLAEAQSVVTKFINTVQTKDINLGIDTKNIQKNMQLVDVKFDSSTKKIETFTVALKTTTGVLSQVFRAIDTPEGRKFELFNTNHLTSSVAKIKEAFEVVKQYQDVTKKLTKAQNEGWSSEKINALIKREQTLNGEYQKSVALLKEMNMSGMGAAVGKMAYDVGDVQDSSYYSQQSKSLKDYQLQQQRIFSTQKLLISAEEKMKSSIGENTEARRKYIATLIAQRDSQIQVADKMYGKMDNETQKKALSIKEEAIQKQQLYRKEVQASYATDTNFFKNLTSGWKDAAARIINYTVIYRSVWTLIKGFQAGVQTIKELNKAFTDIQMVTGATNTEMEKLNDTYAKLAQTMGSTIQEVATGATEWLRQGKSIEETNELLKQSLVLSKTGAMATDDATQYLTSTLNGFGLAADDAENVVDVLSHLDMIAATSSAEIAQGFQRMANSSRDAGITMQESAAIFTTISEVTRKSASTIGESIKTLAARYQNVKVGKFSVNPDDENDSEEYVEGINDIESTLGKLGISIRKSETEWMDMWDVIKQVGAGWATYDDLTKNAIVTT